MPGSLGYNCRMSTYDSSSVFGAQETIVSSEYNCRKVVYEYDSCIRTTARFGGCHFRMKTW